jgi:hypothetical protein
MRAGRAHTFLAIVVVFTVSDAPAIEVRKHVAAASDQQAIWCWGSQRRSANVPFLRIISRGGKVVIETKDYMHSSFIANTKDVLVSNDRLNFAYWYKPLARWSRCSLVTGPSGDTMAGNCDGELSAGQWGSVPSYLWRC